MAPLVMRVIVTGSRTWREQSRVFEALDSFLGPLVVVHGACPEGADFYAHVWCGLAHVTEDLFPADWKQYGRRAGPIRNREMVRAGADLVLAFADWCRKPGCLKPRNHLSHGTDNCIQEAEKARIEVIMFWATGPQVTP